ncbi:hypothetical protein HDE_11038 [Halotydeus destructor]|nr:hypothetical protein HDE_11038 [Halotydeus destructor]
MIPDCFCTYQSCKLVEATKSVKEDWRSKLRAKYPRHEFEQNGLRVCSCHFATPEVMKDKTLDLNTKEEENRLNRFQLKVYETRISQLTKELDSVNQLLRHYFNEDQLKKMKGQLKPSHSTHWSVETLTKAVDVYNMVTSDIIYEKFAKYLFLPSARTIRRHLADIRDGPAPLSESISGDDEQSDAKRLRIDYECLGFPPSPDEYLNRFLSREAVCGDENSNNAQSTPSTGYTREASCSTPVVEVAQQLTENKISSSSGREQATPRKTAVSKKMASNPTVTKVLVKSTDIGNLSAQGSIPTPFIPTALDRFGWQVNKKLRIVYGSETVQVLLVPFDLVRHSNFPPWPKNGDMPEKPKDPATPSTTSQQCTRSTEQHSGRVQYAILRSEQTSDESGQGHSLAGPSLRPMSAARSYSSPHSVTSVAIRNHLNTSCQTYQAYQIESPKSKKFAMYIYLVTAKDKEVSDRSPTSSLPVASANSQAQVAESSTTVTEERTAEMAPESEAAGLIDSIRTKTA